jgi:hypothetical protein
VILYAASAADGAVLGSTGPSGYASLLDIDATRAILSIGGRTVQWTFATDRTRTLTKKAPGEVSIEHDLLAQYTKDPYLGGCTQLVRLSDPSMTLWKSCRDRVAAYSPDGRTMLTFHILTDGIGPGEIHLRTVGGRKLATWTTHWFSGWEWESPSTLLLEVNGAKKASTVRCELDACENATDPVKVSAP